MKYFNTAFAEDFFKFVNISAVKDVVNTIIPPVSGVRMSVLDVT